MIFDSMVLILALLTQSVFSTGQFTNPAGADGQTTYNLGDPATITWTGTSDYNILSLGVYSLTNSTVSWLIENSSDNPTSYTWTVDVDSQGFDLSSSRQFQFYIVNGTDFGAPFESSVFNVQGAPSVTFTTVTATATDSTAATTVTVTAAPTSNYGGSVGVGESRASVGDRVGFFVGLIGGLVLLLGVAAFFYRRHYGKRNAGPRDASNSNQRSSSAAGAQSSGAVPPGSEMQQHQLTEYYSVKMPEPAVIQPAPSVAGPSGQQQTSTT